LKDYGLIMSPAFILMKAADRFANPNLALHPGLEAVHHHVGNRCVRYVAGGAAAVRFEPGQGSASATVVER
jgi:hypothetical protein